LKNNLNFAPTIEPIDKQIETFRNELIDAKPVLNRAIRNTLKSINPELSASNKVPSFQFVDNILADLDHEIETIFREPVRQNINLEDRKLLERLKRDRTIVIKPADKNMGTCVINKHIYLKLANEQHLNDKSTYRELIDDPLKATLTRIQSMIDHLQFSGHLKRIKPACDTCVIGTFYILPKLHKSTLKSRPIISNINHPTEKISEYLDWVINPTAQRAKSYLKNSNQVLLDLKTIKPDDDTILITADISSLYTNIPNKEGIDFVVEEIYLDKDNFHKPTKTAMRTLLFNTLTNNIFEFNGKFYIQVNGTAMGTKMAPAYANTYLKHKEEKKKISDQVELFRRYIDDILISYNNRNKDLDQYLERLKELYSPLILEINYGRKVNFLDLTISIENNKFETCTYRKPMNNTPMLNQASNHPQHTLNNICLGELIRAQRNCSTKTSLDKEEFTILKQTLDAGFSSQDFYKAKKKIIDNKNKVPEDTTIPKIPTYVIMTYNENASKLAKSLKSKWYEEASKIKEVKMPLTISYTTETNLKKQLVRSKLHN